MGLASPVSTRCGWRSSWFFIRPAAGSPASSSGEPHGGGVIFKPNKMILRCMSPLLHPSLRVTMRRREFTKVIIGSALWPLAAGAQTSNKPVIAFLSARSANESAHLVAAFSNGLAEHGLVEGQNVTIDYSWADRAFAAR